MDEWPPEETPQAPDPSLGRERIVARETAHVDEIGHRFRQRSLSRPITCARLNGAGRIHRPASASSETRTCRSSARAKMSTRKSSALMTRKPNVFLQDSTSKDRPRSPECRRGTDHGCGDHVAIVAVGRAPTSGVLAHLTDPSANRSLIGAGFGIGSYQCARQQGEHALGLGPLRQAVSFTQPAVDGAGSFLEDRLAPHHSIQPVQRRLHKEVALVLRQQVCCVDERDGLRRQALQRSRRTGPSSSGLQPADAGSSGRRRSSRTGARWASHCSCGTAAVQHRAGR